MSSRKNNRRSVREKTLQLLYANEMNKDRIELLTEALLSDIDSAADRLFCKELFAKVTRYTPDLDKMIKERVDNWEMDRIALIDKLLLRIGISELLFFPDIPPKVSINEVIEIAKDFSTSKSGKFINGILDAILNELKTEGKLNKFGRGLLEITPTKKSD
ncbi:MAG TPA: transcription antitermination factor NusB [Melioribacteraceae bacterium]|nr:transcription antitermination factor NusB [Melioribacteraceae bacterium]